MRAIRYQRKGFKPQTLLTSMTDPVAYPAAEIAALYHERWEIELGYDGGEDRDARARGDDAQQDASRRLPGTLGPRPRLQPRPPRDGTHRRTRRA